MPNLSQQTMPDTLLSIDSTGKIHTNSFEELATRILDDVPSVMDPRIDELDNSITALSTNLSNNYYTKTSSDARYYQKGIKDSIPYDMINNFGSDGVAFTQTTRFPGTAAPNLVKTGNSNDGIHNTILGSLAGTALTTGYSNTFIGRSAGSGCTTGFQNVIIGRNAATSNFANYNIAIGAATSLLADTSYQIVIGYARGSMGAGTIKIGGPEYSNGTYISGLRNTSSSDLFVTVDSDDRLGARSLTAAVGDLAYSKSYIDEMIYTKVGAGLVFRTIADSYTNTETDTLFRTILDSYSKAEADTLFSTKSETTASIATALTNYYTKPQIDSQRIWYKAPFVSLPIPGPEDPPLPTNAFRVDNLFTLKDPSEISKSKRNSARVLHISSDGEVFTKEQVQIPDSDTENIAIPLLTTIAGGAAGALTGLFVRRGGVSGSVPDPSLGGPDLPEIRLSD